MSVEFIPKNKNCISFGIANGTWFEVLDNTEIAKLLSALKTNNSLNVSKENAEKLLVLMENTEYSDKWNLVHGSDVKLIDIFKEFLTNCDGFTTR